MDQTGHAAGTSATSAHAPEPSVPGAGRWGWWGIVFVAAFVASIVAGNALVVGDTLYLPGASAAQLRGFYQTSVTAVLVQSALQALAAFGLYRFGYRLRSALRSSAGTRSLRVMGGGTTVGAVGLFASVVCSLVLTAIARPASDAVLAGLGRTALVLGGAVHLLGSGVLIMAASAVALRATRMVRWVFHYGRVAGPLVVLSAVSVAVPPLFKPDAAFRLLAAVWIVGVAVAALRGRLAVRQPVRPVPVAGGEA